MENGAGSGHSGLGKQQNRPAEVRERMSMSDEQKRPEFGQCVTWTAVLVRVEETSGRRSWERCDIGGPCSGIYDGYRTLQNGRVINFTQDYDSWENCVIENTPYFQPDEYVSAWVVRKNERTNPVYVLPEDCQWKLPVVRVRVEYSGLDIEDFTGMSINELFGYDFIGGDE